MDTPITTTLAIIGFMAIGLLIGLLVPRGNEISVREVKVVEKVNYCLNPCGMCMDTVIGMKETLESINADGQKTAWCLQDNNWRLLECQRK